jgi:hypothetical protein
MEKKNDAVSPVISAILALLIVSSTMATVLVWGVPYINQLNTTTSIENAGKQFTSVGESISDLTNSNPGNSRIDTLSIDKGEVSAGTSEGKKSRTVIMYSYDRDYNFTVSGFGTCFLTGTKVLMADRSYKNIEEIKIGDKVLSYDEPTGKIVSCKVVNVFAHSPCEMADYYLLINNGLRVTPNHRFYSDGKWVYTGNLKIGDPLFSKDLSSNYQVYSIKKIYEREKSFDLEVENCHTYFVSVQYDGVDVLVHNGQQQTISAEAGGPYYGYAGQTIQFAGSCSETPLSHTPFTYTWNFGDGNTQSGQGLTNPTHQYAAGSYVVTLTVTCAQGHTATDTASVYIGLFPAADTHLMFFNLWKNYGHDSELNIDSMTIGKERTIIRFDLNSLGIPPGSTVTSATLNLYYYGWDNSGFNPYYKSDRQVGCYRIWRDWTEGTGIHGNPSGDGASWAWYTTDHPWDTWGGDIISTATDSQEIPNIQYNGPGTWMHWNVTSDVQNFVNGNNGYDHGWLIKYNTENTGSLCYCAKFYSRECTNPTLRPLLVISFIKCETNEATGVKRNNATFNGIVDKDGGEPCQYSFSYGYYYGSGWTSDVNTAWTGNKRAGESFSYNAQSLYSGILYRYRANIKIASSTLINTGDYKFFLTPGNITGFNAVTLNPKQIALSWGIDNAYGAYITYSKSKAGKGGGSGTIGYAQGSYYLVNVDPVTTYTFTAKAYAQCNGWKSVGNFTAPWGNTMTSSATTPSEPYISTNDSTLVHSKDATLNGYVSFNHSYSCKVFFQYVKYDSSYAYGTNTSEIPMSVNSTFSQLINGLTPNTHYKFRSVVRYGMGYTNFSVDKSFTTFLGGIEIDSPQQGDKWSRGTIQKIQWIYGLNVPFSTTVNITLLKSPSYYLVLSNNYSIGDQNGYGEYNWSINSNQTLGNHNYRIKITSNFDSNIYDYSDYFSITELHEGVAHNETILPIGNNPYHFMLSGHCRGYFDLNMIQGKVTKAEVYWLYYGGELDFCSFSGAVQIDLYDQQNKGSAPYCFGTIVLLDSDSLTYESQSDNGPYSTTIENGGIIYSDSNTNKYLQKAPPIYNGKNTFSMHAVQLVASPYTAGGTGGFKIRMKTIVNNNSIRETDYVYYLRLQFYGDNAETWLEYFESNYNFEMQQSQQYHLADTLFYKPSTSKLWFTFAHTTIGVSFI